jgi:hypothetical protein
VRRMANWAQGARKRGSQSRERWWRSRAISTWRWLPDGHTRTRGKTGRGRCRTGSWWGRKGEGENFDVEGADGFLRWSSTPHGEGTEGGGGDSAGGHMEARGEEGGP